MVAAGAALLPDLDHDDSTASEAFGPLTEALSRVIRWLSGGHRGATHSLFFAALTGAGGYLAGSAGRWWAWAPIVLLAGLALCAVGVTNTPTAVVAAAALTAVAIGYGGARVTWLAPAIAVGVLAHLAGDCLTGHGCRLLWPIPGRTCVRLVDTGGKVESLLVVPVLVAVGTLLVARHAGVGLG